MISVQLHHMPILHKSHETQTCVWTLQVYNPRIRAHSVALRPVSQCQAEQRRQLARPAGTFRLPPDPLGFCFRRHRLSCALSLCLSFFFFHPGKCFRLYPEDERLPAENRPLILESNITPTVLFLKRLEIAGLAQCDFMDRPGECGDRGGGGCIADTILFT